MKIFWSDGYFVCSVGNASAETVRKYIQEQGSLSIHPTDATSCRSVGFLDSFDKLREIARHEQVRMFEIKMSQGAKPGKGGILPGEKVSKEIAEIRGIPVGEDALSPNRHVDINSFDDLVNMINRVRNVTGKPTGFKMVFGKPSQRRAVELQFTK